MAIEDDLHKELLRVFRRLRKVVRRFRSGLSRGKQERALREAIRDLRWDPQVDAPLRGVEDRERERLMAAEVGRVLAERLGPRHDDGIDDQRERADREADHRERAQQEEGERDARAGDVIDAEVVDSSTEPVDRERDKERADREQDNGVPENVVPIAAGTGAAAAIGAEALIDEQRDAEALVALSKQGQPGGIAEALDPGGDLRAQREAAEQGTSPVAAAPDPDDVSEARQESFAETTKGQDVAPGTDPLDSNLDPSERAETEQLDSSPQSATQQEQDPARIAAAEERAAEQRETEQRSEEGGAEAPAAEAEHAGVERSVEERADGREIGEPEPEEQSQARADPDRDAAGPHYEGGSGIEGGNRRIESTDLEHINGGQPDDFDRASGPVDDDDLHYDPSVGPQEADENRDNDRDSLAPPTAGDRRGQVAAENQAENRGEQPGQPDQATTGQAAGMSDEVQKLRDLNHGGQRPASEAATAPAEHPTATPPAGLTAGEQHQRLRKGTQPEPEYSGPERERSIER